ncbi:MAG: DUF2460 domain-containing protein [Pseudomonadota bacterium]
MSSFHDVRFPLGLSLNSEGGPSRRTDIVSLASGREERNSPWAGSRRSFNAGYGVKTLSDIETVIAFFEARHGRLFSFRFRDPFDHGSAPVGNAPSANDQSIGTGDGTTSSFALIKTYSSGAYTHERSITKPVAGTVLVALDGTATTDFSVDTSTGVLSFSQPPGNGAAITAGFLFDVPVRFDSDSLRINLAAFEAGDIPSIPLIEVLS